MTILDYLRLEMRRTQYRLNDLKELDIELRNDLSKLRLALESRFPEIVIAFDKGEYGEETLL